MKEKFNKFKESYLLYSFRRDPVAVTSFVILLLLVVLSVSAPLIAPYNPWNPDSIDIMNSEMPPAWMADGDSAFMLGTDAQGRDLLSTMLYGMRLSITIGLGAVVLQTLLGIMVGLFAGYKGGRFDSFLMRLADVQLSFSTLMVAIFVGALFKAAFGVSQYEELAVPLLVVIIGLAEWPQIARTVRASVLREKGKEYVEGARVIGLTPWWIMIRHILPNTLSSVMVIATVQVANAVMSEAALSFLGLGMPVTRPSLGTLINSGFEYIFSGSWWITLFPAVLLVVLVLVVNLLGDWLRDVMNPKLYKG